MPCSAKMRLIDAPVPTGTVDFITSAWRSDGGIDPTTACTADRSASPGVGRRGAHRHEQQPSVLERRRQLGGEVQPFPVAGHRLGQAGLIDRDLAALQARDLVGVDIDAPHLAAQLGEAGRRRPGRHSRFRSPRLVDVQKPSKTRRVAGRSTQADPGGCGARRRASAARAGQRRRDRDQLRRWESCWSACWRSSSTALGVCQATVVSLPPLAYSSSSLAVHEADAAGAGQERRVLPGRALDAVVLAQHRVERQRHPVGGDAAFRAGRWIMVRPRDRSWRRRPRPPGSCRSCRGSSWSRLDQRREVDRHPQLGELRRLGVAIGDVGGQAGGQSSPVAACRRQPWRRRSPPWRRRSPAWQPASPWGS